MQQAFIGNRILNLLPQAVFATWVPHLEIIDLHMGKVLYEAGSILSHTYFPTTAIVSWINALENGATTEIAMAGREGVVGMYMLMGGGKSHNQAIVQTEGQAIRIPVHVVQDTFKKGQEVQSIFWLFTRALIAQMAQIAACHRHHTLDQQLCRMLLMTLDRIDGNTIVMTHEVIASLLGVRREGVTMAAQKLMHEGIINYARGRITVLNKEALKQRACECYGVIHQEYERLLHLSESSHQLLAVTPKPSDCGSHNASSQPLCADLPYA
jgi:CRP-like cAMP-binding protein